MVRAVHLRVLPETRGECVGGVRPCPLVSCRHHLLLHVRANGRMDVDFDENDPDSIADAITSLPETCALDVADRGDEGDWRDMKRGASLPLEEVARLIGIESVWRVHEIEQEALEKVAVLMADDHPDDPYFRIMVEQELKKR